MIFIAYAVCVLILLPLHLVWLLVCCLYKEVYFQISICVSFDCTVVAGSSKAGSVNRLTTQVGLLVTPTDRLKSVRNRCVIKRLQDGFKTSYTLRWHC